MVALTYNFGFALHGRADDTIHAPWRSRHGPGNTTSRPWFRLLASNRRRLLGAAGRPHLHRAGKPRHGVLGGVSPIPRGFTWFRGTPGDTKPIPRVLNGHNFALFGVTTTTGLPTRRDAGALFGNQRQNGAALRTCPA